MSWNPERTSSSWPTVMKKNLATNPRWRPCETKGQHVSKTCHCRERASVVYSISTYRQSTIGNCIDNTRLRWSSVTGDLANSSLSIFSKKKNKIYIYIITKHHDVGRTSFIGDVIPVLISYRYSTSLGIFREWKLGYLRIKVMCCSHDGNDWLPEQHLCCKPLNSSKNS